MTINRALHLQTHWYCRVEGIRLGANVPIQGVRGSQWTVLQQRSLFYTYVMPNAQRHSSPN